MLQQEKQEKERLFIVSGKYLLLEPSSILAGSAWQSCATKALFLS